MAAACRSPNAATGEGRRVFIDLKLHDIPNTVERAARQIARLGARFLTVHGYPQSMTAALAGVAGTDLQLLAVTVMTSYDDADLKTAGYGFGVRELVERRAQQARDIGIHGLILSPEEAQAVRALVGPDMQLRAPASVPRVLRRRRSEAHHDAGIGDRRQRRPAGRRPSGHRGGRSRGGGARHRGGHRRGARAGRQDQHKQAIGETTMAKGYWIARLEVNNPTATRPMSRPTARSSPNTARAFWSAPDSSNAAKARPKP